MTRPYYARIYTARTPPLVGQDRKAKCKRTNGPTRPLSPSYNGRIAEPSNSAVLPAVCYNLAHYFSHYPHAAAKSKKRKNSPNNFADPSPCSKGTPCACETAKGPMGSTSNEGNAEAGYPRYPRGQAARG